MGHLGKEVSDGEIQVFRVVCCRNDSLRGVFFLVALFLKGFTRALFRETGVVLVSIKLILMAQKDAKAEESLERRLTRIDELLLGRRDSESSGK
jgi:hypothetical protein